MTTDLVLHPLTYAGSVIAVGAAALRLASYWTQDGSERLIAAAPLAGTVVMVQSMGLGLAGVGTNAAALGVASLVTWVVVARLVPSPAITPARQFAAWWSSLPTLPRLGMGALVGGATTFLVYFLARPLLVGDVVTYHLPLATAWVHDGHPGSLHHVYRTLAVENYPLTDEVLLSWQLGLSGSLVPLSVWPLPLVLLGGSAAVTGLVRMRGASKIVAIAGAAALLTTPLLLVGMFSHATDASTLAWILIASALVGCSRDRPLLLVPALLAAALSIGTRTQSAPVLVAIFVWALVIHRPWRGLRAYKLHLGLAGLLAVLVGGFWYLRTTALHGSPFWPALGTPWGDPSSSYFDGAPRFFDQPFFYFTHVLNHRVKAGGVPLLLMGVLAPLFTRRTAVRVCAMVAALGAALWMFTPFSGETGFATTRYLFPLMAAAMAALVLAAGEKPRVLFVFVLAFLLASTSWNLFQLSGPFIDGFVRPVTLLGGAALGALLAFAVPTMWPDKLLSLPAVVRAAVLAVAISSVFAAFAPGYLQRHLDVESRRQRVNTFVPVGRWLTEQRGFQNGDDPIAMTRSLYGPVTGDRVKHRLTLVRDNASCATFEEHTATGWLILRRSERGKEAPGYRRARDCLDNRAPVYSTSDYEVFTDRVPRSR